MVVVGCSQETGTEEARWAVVQGKRPSQDRVGEDSSRSATQGQLATQGQGRRISQLSVCDKAATHKPHLNTVWDVLPASDPIIIVPNGALDLITMANAGEFLEKSHYVSHAETSLSCWPLLTLPTNGRVSSCRLSLCHGVRCSSHRKSARSVLMRRSG